MVWFDAKSTGASGLFQSKVCMQIDRTGKIVLVLGHGNIEKGHAGDNFGLTPQLVCATDHKTNAPSDVGWIGAVVRLRQCANASGRMYDAVRDAAHKVLDDLHAQQLREVHDVSTSRCCMLLCVPALNARTYVCSKACSGNASAGTLTFESASLLCKQGEFPQQAVRGARMRVDSLLAL